MKLEFCFNLVIQCLRKTWNEEIRSFLKKGEGNKKLGKERNAWKVEKKFHL